MAVPRLTSLSHGAGCACKIDAASLASVLGALPLDAPDLLVDASHSDDAAVMALDADTCAVLTTDFFTPIVDDPYDYGRIAAANALSDIYAMGARPVLALNILAVPLDQLGPDLVRRVLKGGADVAASAGVVIGGGHSIDDPEPKFGLAVLGLVARDSVVSNSGGLPGDQLYLSKPIGGGLVTTAAKHDLAEPELVASAIDVMTTLNASASRAAVDAKASAMTDVSGFGLLGHLHELCAASGCSAEVNSCQIPTIPGVIKLAEHDRCVSGGSRRNGLNATEFTRWSRDVARTHRVLLNDAMTSGGLLIAARPGLDPSLGAPVGRLVEGPAGEIHVF